MKISNIAGFICHRRPDRSFFYKGRQFPVCARCAGIYIGYVIGIVGVYTGLKSSLLTWMAMVPLIIDGSVQWIFEYESTNIRRLITGILFGVGLIASLSSLISFVGGLGREFYYWLF